MFQGVNGTREWKFEEAKVQWEQKVDGTFSLWTFHLLKVKRPGGKKVRYLVKLKQQPTETEKNFTYCLCDFCDCLTFGKLCVLLLQRFNENDLTFAVTTSLNNQPVKHSTLLGAYFLFWQRKYWPIHKITQTRATHLNLLWKWWRIVGRIWQLFPCGICIYET